MVFAELRKREGYISGLVALEKVFPSRARSWTKKFIFVAAPIFMMTLFNFSNLLIVSSNFLFGVFLLITTLWLLLFMLDCFYYAHYFYGTIFSIREWGVDSGPDVVPFEVLEIVSGTHSSDLTEGFLNSRAGLDIAKRLGLEEGAVEKFLTGDRNRRYADSVNFPDRLTLTLYATTVFDADANLADFLRSRGITREFFVGAASWVSHIYQSRKEVYRWWGRDALGRIKGVGKEWAVKEVYLLKEFGEFLRAEEEDLTFKREIDDLERALARPAYPNALVVAKDVSEFMATVTGLASRINDGTALSQISHKKLLVLDTEAMEKTALTNEQFSSLVTNLFTQAHFAGHIIFVIKDFPSFVFSFKKRDLDVIQILSPFLSSPDIQVIGFSIRDIYEKVLQNESALLSRFQLLQVERDAKVVVIRALENKVFEIERRANLFFTYQALVDIVDRASAEVTGSDIAIEDRALSIFQTTVRRLVGSMGKNGGRILKEKSRRRVTVADVK